MDYFKERRAFRKLLTEELDLSLGQVSLFRELLDYANDEGKMDDYFKLRNSVLASRTGLTEEGVKSARNRLVQENLIEYIPGRKNKSNPSYKLVQLYTEHPKQSTNSTPTRLEPVPQPAPQPTPQTAPHKNLLVPDYDKTKRDSPHSRKREYADDSPAMIEARYLWEKIKGNNPEHRKPNLQAWADEIRKMHEIDKRPFEKIHRMIDWCQLDTFWQTNILSAAKLRQKYDTMAAQANRKFSTGKPVRTEELPVWAQDGYKPKHKKVSEEDRAKLAEQMEQLKALGKKEDSK